MALAVEPGYITIIPKIYRARQGAWITDKDAEVIGPELVRLVMTEHNTVDAIIDAARDLESPLHPYLTWDVQEAAKKRLRDEVRALVRSIVVPLRQIDTQGNVVHEEWVRALHPIKVITVPSSTGRVTEAQRQIVPTQILRDNMEQSQQIVRYAADQLASWRERYRQYRYLFEVDHKFGPVFDAIDRVLDGDEAAQ